jgi:hypothetical protein
MAKIVLYRAFRLALILAMVIPLCVSPGLAQTPVPENPDRGLHDLPDYSRDLPASVLQECPATPSSVDAARLPWSKVVFHSYTESSAAEIYIANDDGGNQVRLTNNGNEDIHPRLNKGGTRIIFASNRSGNFDIYSMYPNGSSQTRLTGNSRDEVNPVWSPDGTKIAFQQIVSTTNSDIWVMNADGSSQTRLTNTADYEGQPYWSPDGSKITFTAYRNNQWRIWVMNANGTIQTQLSNIPYSGDPAWSPDGSQIAFDSDSNGDGWYEVWLMNADGSNQHSVYIPCCAQDVWVNGWSPDGAWITFTHLFWTDYNAVQLSSTGLEIISPFETTPISLLSGSWNFFPDWQTLDIQAPTTGMQALPVTSPGPFPVSWSGSDIGGAGVRSFDVQVRDGLAGAWTDWLVNFDFTTAAYPGLGGHTYYFRVRARDQAFNVQAWPADYQAFTTVESMPPQSAVLPLSPFSSTQVLVQWAGKDQGGSGIKSFSLQYKDITAGGGWTDWKTNLASTSAVFSGISEHTYAFRARATDNAGNQEAWPASDISDTVTTLASVALSGMVMDNTGNPISGAVVTTSPEPFSAHSSGVDGRYDANVTSSGSSVTASWSKAGYGLLPQTTFDVPSQPQVSVVLPPADNLVTNPALEFSSGIEAPWSASGDILPGPSTSKHTGSTSVLLGDMPGGFAPQVDLNQVSSVSYASYGVMAVEDNGTVHAVVIGTTINYVHSTSEGGWSSPVQIGINAYIYYYPPLLLLAPDGTLHFLWDEANTLKYTHRDTQGNWSPPIQITPLDAGLNNTKNISAAVDAGSNLHILYLTVTSKGNQAFYVQRTAGGTWSTPKAISLNGLTKTDPTLLVDKYGIPHVLWIENSELVDIQRSSLGFWLAPQIIENARAYTVRVDEDANLYLVWSTATLGNTSGEIYFSWRSVNGIWSNPLNISSDPTAIGVLPVLALGPGNSVHLIWNSFKQESGWSLIYRYLPSGGSWTTPQIITNTALGYKPSIIIDKQDTPTVFWVADFDFIDRLSVHYSKLVGGFWTPHTEIGKYSEGSPMSFYVTADNNDSMHFIAPGWDQIYYVGPRRILSDSSSSLSQTVTLLPVVTSPVLSCIYNFSKAVYGSDASFAVKVTREGDTTVLLSKNTSTPGWTHAWFDLTPLANQEITVTFNVSLPAGSLPAYALVDDVTIGSGMPDLWITPGGSPTSAMPGSAVQLELAFGNHGVPPAVGNTVSYSLPNQLTFFSADPTPTSADGQVLTWDVGDLAGHSGSFTIHITATLSTDAALLTTIEGSAQITTSSTELETANNTIQIPIFIGAKVFVPVITR